MLIQERLERCELSVSERAVADFILKEKMNIRDMTTREIAQAVFSSPSTLVRIAHKMNFSGWNELKEALLKEEEYLQTHFTDIDANLPFKKTDSIMSVAAKIAALKKESIEDTLSLISHDDLQKAVTMLYNASAIHLFAVSNNLLICREFQHNMARIGRHVEIQDIQGELTYMAYLAKPSSCALMVSYSGETPILIRAAKTLKDHGIPLLLLTNIGDNSLLPLADCALRICTREKLYSKIATFSTDASFEYLLDVLYSCVFRRDYDKNLQLKIQSAQAIERGRSRTTVGIIQEEGGRSAL